MSKQTLVFNDIEVDKKYFYASKKAIPLNLVNTNNIVISYRVKQNNDTYKYFIGYYMMMVRLNLCVLFYHRSVDVSSILKMVGKACHLKLKMKMCI